ncbi:hypothetical protein JXO52_14505 [bacterium]|nr:hypothetical protein [bacterium]
MTHKYIRIPLMVIGGLALAGLAALLFGWILMLLWNWLMPLIFGLPQIGFWQAWGLIIISHLLFKAGPHHGHHPPRTTHPRYWKEHFRDRMKQHFPDREDVELADN